MATGFARMAFVMIERCGQRATVRLPIPVDKWKVVAVRRERDDLLMDLKLLPAQPKPKPVPNPLIESEKPTSR